MDRDHEITEHSESSEASSEIEPVHEKDIGVSKTKTPNLAFPDLPDQDLLKRAYKVIMEVAMDKYNWLRDIPALRSLRDATDSQGGTDMSMATAVIPMPASDFISMMMNVTEWEKSFLHIIHGSAVVDTGNFLQFFQIEDPAIKNLVGVFTKLQLPTTLVPMWDFWFLRYLKKITQGIYVIIIDVSTNFFDTILKPNRRLSGVIIKDDGDQNSEIIWLDVMILNVPYETIYSPIVNSLKLFEAQRWISTLLSKLKRQSSAFSELNIDVHERVKLNQTLRFDHGAAGPNLLEIADAMKLFYKECIAEDPDKKMFEVYASGEDNVRLMGLKRCMAEENLDLAFSSLHNSEEPEQLFKFATDDGSNSMTLHRKKIGEGYKYYLQEASRDEYCSYVISRPMNQDEVDRYIISGPESLMDMSKEKLQNTAVSGFAIMPDGPGGLKSDGSLVTYVMQLNRHPKIDFGQSINEVIDELYETGRFLMDSELKKLWGKAKDGRSTPPIVVENCSRKHEKCSKGS
ncbi:hypothetical protein COLO4_11899 [Corchorus olitorius]|uniref:START domain-containing protein n=1 Tax=Corchorus olitorius TaxID=93759 RepID=A0A1R3K2S2_9ROSI|nr:hypothetical protein COLO4_11899 [Corchorus olitorius]